MCPARHVFVMLVMCFVLSLQPLDFMVFPKHRPYVTCDGLNFEKNVLGEKCIFY